MYIYLIKQGQLVLHAVSCFCIVLLFLVASVVPKNVLVNSPSLWLLRVRNNSLSAKLHLNCFALGPELMLTFEVLNLHRSCTVIILTRGRVVHIWPVNKKTVPPNDTVH